MEERIKNIFYNEDFNDDEKINKILEIINEIDTLRDKQAEVVNTSSKKWNEIFEFIHSNSSLWNRYTKLSNNPLVERELIIPFLKLMMDELNDCNTKINESKRILSNSVLTDAEKIYAINNLL